jgi:hypothetical protein
MALTAAGELSSMRARAQPAAQQSDLMWPAILQRPLHKPAPTLLAGLRLERWGAEQRLQVRKGGDRSSPAAHRSLLLLENEKS